MPPKGGGELCFYIVKVQKIADHRPSPKRGNILCLSIQNGYVGGGGVNNVVKIS